MFCLHNVSFTFVCSRSAITSSLRDLNIILPCFLIPTLAFCGPFTKHLQSATQSHTPDYKAPSLNVSKSFPLNLECPVFLTCKRFTLTSSHSVVWTLPFSLDILEYYFLRIIQVSSCLSCCVLTVSFIWKNSFLSTSHGWLLLVTQFLLECYLLQESLTHHPI